MKNYIFAETLGEMVDRFQPKIIIETGTHRGRSGIFMVQRALQYNQDVFYHGFDLFEMATVETDKIEINGKGSGSYDLALGRFNKLKSKHPGFDFRLYRGFTTDTFTTPIQADLAYIDGGHSTHTVLHDYSMVKESKVVVFDDFHMDSVKEALHLAGIFNRLIVVDGNRKTHQAIFINP